MNRALPNPGFWIGGIVAVLSALAIDLYSILPGLIKFSLGIFMAFSFTQVGQFLWEQSK